MTTFIRRHALYIAWGTALAAMLGSLYFSEIRGWVPCVLCWYQRICIYPLVVVLGVGILRGDHHIRWHVLPLAIAGALIGMYQYLLQIGVLAEKLAPCTNGVSCLTRYATWFGFITIPLLSFFAFVVIIISVLIYKKDN